jgi:hypothetical protein
MIVTRSRFAAAALCISALALLLTVSLQPLQPAFAVGAVRGNSGFNANIFPGNDDGSTGPVNIGFSINFYGLNFTQLYVNNNGNVTFDAPLSTFTPFDLTSTGRQIIAPFFADVDTRVGNVTRYGQDVVDGRPAFGVNWIDVGYFNQSVDKLNSFQLVLIDRSDIAPGDFDFEFNYDRIQWETGSASGGVNGLGGNSARVGYSNGTGVPGTFFELPGSAINGAFLDGGPNSLVANSLNSSVPGRYVFRVRGGTVQDVDVQTSSTPCLAVTFPDSVVGSLPNGSPAYYRPGDLAPGVFIRPGTYWVIGVDASGEYYKIVLACQYLWVPVSAMQPNFDAVWQGRPLPTRVVDGASTGVK